MDSLAMAMIISQSVSRREATSALPDAPIVEDTMRERRPRASRSRTALARALQHAAAAVAPAPSAPRAAARNT
jgi:hypothetical protein